MPATGSATTLLRSSPAALTWRLIRDEPRSGARNMALDHALAACLEGGEGVVRLYGWERPTVSFGKNEPARAQYSAAAAAAAGVDVVRRPTGGRAVLHWRELTYAVVAPLDAWGGLRQAYFAIHGALAGALEALGVWADAPGGAGPARPSARRPPERATPPLDAGPCFQAPAPGEIVVGGRKLVGSAQARLEGVLLQHGSILLEDDQPVLARLGGNRPLHVAPATLRELVGDVGIDALTDLVAKSLRLEFGGAWTSKGYRPSEIEAAERLEADRYAHDSWTWRR
jgi:lipoate-protein ligase A